MLFAPLRIPNKKSSLPQVRQTAFDDSILQLLFLLLLNRIHIQIKHIRPRALLHFHFVILYLRTTKGQSHGHGDTGNG